MIWYLQGGAVKFYAISLPFPILQEKLYYGILGKDKK